MGSAFCADGVGFLRFERFPRPPARPLPPLPRPLPLPDMVEEGGRGNDANDDSRDEIIFYY